jgi:hypothetical protein
LDKKISLLKSRNNKGNSTVKDKNVIAPVLFYIENLTKVFCIPKANNGMIILEAEST